MVPSRGLRPAHLAHCASRRSLHLRSNVSRQFSSIPRSTTCRTSPLQPANWRSRSSHPRHAILNASTVRHGSWYAPWAWGGANTPPPVPAATTATPEPAPAGIVEAPAIESAAAGKPARASVEDLVQDVLNDVYVPPDSIGNAAAAIEKVGALKDMGLDFGWGPTALFEWCLEHIYIYSGWGWGASILACTVLIRTFGFYFQLKGSDNMARVAAVNPILRDVQEQMSEAMKNRDEVKTKLLRRQQIDVYRRAGVHPIKGMLPLFVQGAFGFGAFRCLRNMAALPVPGLSEGGFVWFTDLTVHDPYFVLPLSSALVFHVMMKYGGETGASNQTMAPGFRFAMQYGMPVVMFSFTGWLSSGIQLYLLFTTILGTATARLLRSPTFRQRLNLAPLPTPESQAYWAKVLKDRTPLEEAIPAAAKPKSPLPQPKKPTYQAPRSIKTHIQNRGLNVKPSASIPAHLRPQEETQKFMDRDHDYDKIPDGAHKKLDWFRRNYKWKYVRMRMILRAARWTGRKDLMDMATKNQSDAAKAKAEEYEWRRRQRFGQK